MKRKKKTCNFLKCWVHHNDVINDVINGDVDDSNSSFISGAIGDVDGDGKLDVIVNVVSVGILRDEFAR